MSNHETRKRAVACQNVTAPTGTVKAPTITTATITVYIGNVTP